jgi:hypothetical protein
MAKVRKIVKRLLAGTIFLAISVDALSQLHEYAVRRGHALYQQEWRKLITGTLRPPDQNRPEEQALIASFKDECNRYRRFPELAAMPHCAVLLRRDFDVIDSDDSVDRRDKVRFQDYFLRKRC